MNTLRRRAEKPTIEIPRRTIAECAARYAALRSAVELGLPTLGLELDR